MKLSGTDGQAFAMRILQYQFPAMETEDYDSNWLIIQGEVSHPKGSRRFRDPCLPTYEGAYLASWLETVADGKTLPTTCAFIEPNLEFQVTTGSLKAVLRVYFELESRPSWAPWGLSRGVGDRDLWVEFPLSELDLTSIVQQWRQELSVYPQRAAR